MPPSKVFAFSSFSIISKSRSVAVKVIPLSSAIILTLDKIGIVFLLSTTLCIWPRLLRRISLSIDILINSILLIILVIKPN